MSEFVDLRQFNYQMFGGSLEEAKAAYEKRYGRKPAFIVAHPDTAADNPVLTAAWCRKGCWYIHPSRKEMEK